MSVRCIRRLAGASPGPGSTEQPANHGAEQPANHGPWDSGPPRLHSKPSVGAEFGTGHPVPGSQATAERGKSITATGET